jgi:hypothetical protein
MMSEANIVALIERRLTLLEREVADLKASISGGAEGAQPPQYIQIGCDAPGLIASRAYELEKEGGRSFCWIGSSQAIQVKLPIAPVKPAICSITMKPHPQVEMGNLRLIVNDHQTSFKMVKTGENSLLVFNVPASSRPHIDIYFDRIRSIRPIDTGEGDDTRLLAFRFYGAEVEYSLEETGSGEVRR